MTTPMTLNGKKIEEFEIDFYGMSLGEIQSGDVLFTYAAFEDDKPLTNSQLYILSKKYPQVIYLLVQDLLKSNQTA